MKFVFSILFFVIAFATFSQEELGEGDIYMQNLAKQDTFIESVEKFEVPYLFTSLAFEEVKERAKQEQKYFFIDFTADWCAPCKMMDQTTFRDFNVVKYAQDNYFAVQLDMTDFDAIEMQAKYKIESLPTILFFDFNGNLLGRSTGLQTGTLFLEELKKFNTSF